MQSLCLLHISDIRILTILVTYKLNNDRLEGLSTRIANQLDTKVGSKAKVKKL